MIKAIIFDLDNTLIDRQKVFKTMLETEIPKIIPNDPRINEMIEDIMIWDDNGNVERIDSFQKWIDKYHITQITAKEFSDNWSNQSGSIAILFDDVKETLKKLKENYKIAILTNGNAISQRRKLKTIDLYDLLDYSLVSSEFTVRKPDPSIFKYVAQQLNVEPSECVYVGDNYKVDVLGSSSAGMNAIYVNRNNSTNVPFTTISNISELLKLY